MSEREPHPDALRNHEVAHIPDEKIRRYALGDPDKRRPFEALGYGEEFGNWEELRERIREALPFYPARLVERTKWGAVFRVDMPMAGPSGEEAPIRTGWIYLAGEDFPRLTTRYVKTHEWRRKSGKGRIEP